MDDTTIVLTKHAVQRVRQRVGIPKKAVDKNVRVALAQGIRRNETGGAFRRYLTAILLAHRDDRPIDDLRVWCGKIYLFSGATFVTVLRLPPQYRKAEAKLIRRKENPT